MHVLFRLRENGNIRLSWWRREALDT